MDPTFPGRTNTIEMLIVAEWVSWAVSELYKKNGNLEAEQSGLARRLAAVSGGPGQASPTTGSPAMPRHRQL